MMLCIDDRRLVRSNTSKEDNKGGLRTETGRQPLARVVEKHDSLVSMRASCAVLSLTEVSLESADSAASASVSEPNTPVRWLSR